MPCRVHRQGGTVTSERASSERLRLYVCRCCCFTWHATRLVMGNFGAEESDNKINVQVVLRCRPLLQREIDEGAESVLTCRRNEVCVKLLVADDGQV